MISLRMNSDPKSNNRAQTGHERPRISSKIILRQSTQGRCAIGIIQAIGYFGLGPSVSPRDIRDLEELGRGESNPSVEVAKFYLLYERWRRGEVEESNQFIYFRWSTCSSFWNGSIDLLAESYRDKQGKKFRVWVDKLSVAQIGSGKRLVKFYKWEMSGEKRQVSVTKVLLSSRRVETPGGFLWLHMHQTWLEGSSTKDNDWLF